MKKIILIIIVMFAIIQPHFAQKEVKVSSKIEKVTIYRNSAQVFRKSEVDIPAGNSKIMIKGLSSKLDPNSLKFSGKGNFIILEYQTEIFYPEPEVEIKIEIPQSILTRIRILNDSLELIQSLMEENNARRDLLGVEANMLKTSKAITSADTVTELKEVLNFYRAKMTDINNEWFKVKKIEKQLLKVQTKIKEKLTELNDYKNKINTKTNQEKPESIVILTLQAEKPVLNGTINFSYSVNAASWVPNYELKIDDVSKPVQLTMKASITQNTDENWDKVKLTLSTGTPNSNKAIPSLMPWFITYYMRATTTNAQMYSNIVAPVSTSEKLKRTSDNETDEVSKETGYSYEYVEQTTNMLNTEYNINLLYEIPSDNKPHNIMIFNESLNGSYSYVAIPKLDKDAFLTASLTGWEKLDLIPAKANIFFENSIIGQTYINPLTADDSLIVSLGTDKKVFVDRKKISDKSKDKIIGSIRERTITIEITVKNQNQSTITLQLKDQFPVSKNNDIKIETLAVKDATVNTETGIIEWDLNLKPNETKKLSFTYTIKSDKNKPLLYE